MADQPLKILDFISYIAEMAKEFAETSSINNILTIVMKHIGKIFSPQNWSILLKDSKTGDLRFAIVIGNQERKLTNMIQPRGRGVAGWISENGSSVIIEDVSRDERFDGRMDAYTGFKTTSLIGVPLKTKKKVFGVIELVNKLDGKPFSKAELVILEVIADMTAIAIERAFYFQGLEKIAYRDALTGLYNRRSFIKMFESERERCQSADSTISFLFIDVDNFKVINDTYGHMVGDMVLKNLAIILKKSARKTDMVFRYDGDEFIVMMPDTLQKTADAFERKIKKSIAEYNARNKITLSVSIGKRSSCAESASEVLYAADMEMYKRKKDKIVIEVDNLSGPIVDSINKGH